MNVFLVLVQIRNFVLSVN